MVLLSLMAVVIVVYIRLQPLRAYHEFPPYQGPNNFTWSKSDYNSAKKTVLIMADNDMTELFDFLTPYYLFNETRQANVYVIAQRKFPIVTENGPYFLPDYTYHEIDSLKIHSDVIVIPYMHNAESKEKTEWLKRRYTDSLNILSVCDGAWTAAASGIYNGIPLTSHATGHGKIKEKYPFPNWVQNVTYTQSNNLFSTGGVSNATDGTLAVINKVFGRQTMKRIMKQVHYPHKQLNLTHKSQPLSIGPKFAALYKMIFKKNKTVGVLLQNGVSEMDLGAVFDIYARSMPSAILAVPGDDNMIRTKHGLRVITMDSVYANEVDELHVLHGEGVSGRLRKKFNKTKWVEYDNKNKYIIDFCLEKIRSQYSEGFTEFVKLTLDYN